MADEPRKLTLGERSVGLNFNPSGSQDVSDIKEACAYLIDMLDKRTDLNDPIQRKMRDAAMAQVESAQMWAVKVVTWNLIEEKS